ncbi:MFS transporter [Haliscomenobacter sp.]|uniref:MFS transporter n=1 Tax=Haliscomenobacter sp. TaxID=2717303 RepID=UPI003364EE72
MSSALLKFTPYQWLVVAILATLQFTIILDFMVLSPLGAQLLAELSITTTQFGLVVSAYAFSAGISGILAAGFADRFDRKILLLFFYAGFIVGTLLCGIAPTYSFLMMARIVTGIFGGVIGSIAFAIITDLFPLEMRGRVMGFVQMAFAVSQIMGLPVGLYFANLFDWHAPFLLIVGISIPMFFLILLRLKPVTLHLALQKDQSAFSHLLATVSKPRYLQGFLGTILLSTGGFMLMPFGSTFSINNLGVTFDQLPIIYLVTGVCSMIAGPLIGRLSDSIGSIKVFTIGSILTIIIVVIYCNFGVTPLWIIILMSVLMFVGITSRMISSTALVSGIPAPADRGAFMGVNASISQISGGIASGIAGMIVHQAADGHLENYPLLGYVVAGTMVVAIGLMYNIHRMVKGNAN